MLVLPTFFIFVSLSVAAIPLLGPHANGQTPHIRRLTSIADLTKVIPVPADAAKEIIQILPRPDLLKGRFIMGADYASSSGPFLGKSSHKRQEPLFDTLGSPTTTLRANDLKGQIPPNLSPGSAPT